MLDGRALGASQVEYKPFGKPPLKREAWTRELQLRPRSRTVVAVSANRAPATQRGGRLLEGAAWPRRMPSGTVRTSFMWCVLAHCVGRRVNKHTGQRPQAARAPSSAPLDLAYCDCSSCAQIFFKVLDAKPVVQTLGLERASLQGRAEGRWTIRAARLATSSSAHGGSPLNMPASEGRQGSYLEQRGDQIIKASSESFFLARPQAHLARAARLRSLSMRL